NPTACRGLTGVENDDSHMTRSRSSRDLEPSTPIRLVEPFRIRRERHPGHNLVRIEDDWRAVVEALQRASRGHREDGEAVHLPIVGGVCLIPDAGEQIRLAIGPAEAPLFLRALLPGPFIPSRPRHHTPTAREGSFEYG